MAHVTRYAITHLAKNGLRSLAFANQGRNHYDTREQAQQALDTLQSSLHSKLGMVALEVRPIECYEHGDAVGIFCDTDFQKVSDTPQFTKNCCACGKHTSSKDLFADTTGTPWKAYYCAECSRAARELQDIQRTIR